MNLLFLFSSATPRSRCLLRLCVVTLCVCIVSATEVLSQAQRGDHGDTQPDVVNVFVRFTPGAVSFPGVDAGQGSSVDVSLSEATFTNTELRSTLVSLGAANARSICENWRHLDGPVENHRGETVELVDFTDVYVIRFEDSPLEDLPAYLRSLEGVVYAHHPPEFRVGYTPNDTLYEDQWHLHNTGQTYNGDDCDEGFDIDAPAAWDIVQGTGTRIAFLDIGIFAHTDLNQYISSTLSLGFGSNSTSAESSSCTGSASHGTSVAGVALAAGNNSAGIAGVANTPAQVSTTPIVALNVMDGSCQYIDAEAAMDALAPKQARLEPGTGLRTGPFWRHTSPSLRLTRSFGPHRCPLI